LQQLADHQLDGLLVEVEDLDNTYGYLPGFGGIGGGGRRTQGGLSAISGSINTPAEVEVDPQ
jgi:hypothetical protein